MTDHTEVERILAVTRRRRLTTREVARALKLFGPDVDLLRTRLERYRDRGWIAYCTATDRWRPCDDEALDIARSRYSGSGTKSDLRPHDDAALWHVAQAPAVERVGSGVLLSYTVRAELLLTMLRERGVPVPAGADVRIQADGRAVSVWWPA